MRGGGEQRNASAEDRGELKPSASQLAEGGLGWRRSLLREELQRAIGGGELTNGVAAPLGEAGRRGGLVVDVDAAVGTLDRRRAGR